MTRRGLIFPSPTIVINCELYSRKQNRTWSVVDHNKSFRNVIGWVIGIKHHSDGTIARDKADSSKMQTHSLEPCTELTAIPLRSQGKTLSSILSEDDIRTTDSDSESKGSEPERAEDSLRYLESTSTKLVARYDSLCKPT